MWGGTYANKSAEPAVEFVPTSAASVAKKVRKSRKLVKKPNGKRKQTTKKTPKTKSKVTRKNKITKKNTVKRLKKSKLGLVI